MNTEQKMARFNELMNEIADHKAQIMRLTDEARSLFDAAPLAPPAPVMPVTAPIAPVQAPVQVPESRLRLGVHCDSEFAPFDRALRRASERELKAEVKGAFLANPGKRFSLDTLARTMLHRDRARIFARLEALTQSGILVRGKAFAPNSNRTVDYWMLQSTAAISTPVFPGMPRSPRTVRARARGVSATTYAAAREHVLRVLGQRHPLTIKEMGLSYSSSTRHMIIKKMVDDNLLTSSPRAGTRFPTQEYSIKR